MIQEWFAKCKDCGKSFGYSATAEQSAVARGLSRPERCILCRQRHRREISTIGLTHLELSPLTPPRPEGISAGNLGRLVRPAREHKLRQSSGHYDFSKFAIKDHHLEEFFGLLEEHQVCVIVAPTGAGKSTLLPYRLMAPPDFVPANFFTQRGQILITQPRIQATRNIPDFVATKLHGSTLGPGFDIGFRHSGSPQMDRANKLVYVTDGTLINMIVRNELPQLGVIMIDEAHERSLNIDLILGLLKSQLPRFPHLRLIIASATIDLGKFVDFFGGKGVVGSYQFPGERPFPIAVRYHDGDPIPPNQMPALMPQLVADKVIAILQAMDERQEVEGDILAFLHGEKPILRAVSLIRDEVDADRRLAGRVDVLPLFTRLTQQQQDAALQPKKDPKRRRVVISTNVAETSLTVDGVVHVVDSGLINQSEWDLRTNTTFVATTRHSRAGCRQRWGRAGRKAPGVAHCLYTEAQFNDDEVFAPFSQPEIQRAPLEQIVLTAKAAGIDDIRTFPWIEAPPSAELGRAPEVLQRMGALDCDGDLTAHGSELRAFAEEPEISNLMILADRFGCATEMATVIAMRRLRNLRDLFSWDREWDATTKYTVHQRQNALMAPCRDDLEFSLKIWEAWEGTLFQRNENRLRKSWAEENFVIHEIFDRRVSADREALLSGLSGHKKESESRATDFRLLDKLRILLVHGLSTHLYRRDDSSDTEDVRFLPFLLKPESSPHLVALHKNATITISHDSVCSQKPPNIFVCARRRRWLERRSPLKEPSVHVCASFIVSLKENWLQAAGLSGIELVHFLAKETRLNTGELIGEFLPKALFVEQFFPLGSKVIAQKIEGELRVERVNQPPPRIRMQRRWQRSLEVTETIESDDLDEDSFHASHELFSPQRDWLDDDESLPLSGPKSFGGFACAAKFEGKVDSANRAEGVVYGYDLTTRSTPTIRLELPALPSPFDQFCQLFRVGDEIPVDVVSVQRFLQERLTYLVVREPRSGLEIVLDPYELNLIGRNFAFESRLSAGDLVIVSVEQIVMPRGRYEIGQVRASRLRFSAEAVQAFTKKFSNKIVEAEIADVVEEGVYLWLNPDASPKDEAIGAFVPTSFLLQRPDEMSLHQRCQIIARPRDFSGRRRFGRQVRSASEQLVRVVKSISELNWDNERHAIELRGPVNWNHRVKLLAAANKDDKLIETVERLFTVSHDLEVRLVDVRLFAELEKLKHSGERVQATVIRIEHDVVVVSLLDGAQGRVFRDGLNIPPSQDLAKFAPVGTQLSLRVKDLDMLKNRVILTSLESVTFRLPNDKKGHLIGTAGATIKRLEAETGVAIRMLRESDEVTISGKDLAAVARALEVIEEHLNFYSAVARIDPSRAHVLFFDGARILKSIRNSFGLRVDLEKGADNRSTGRIDFRGDKQEGFDGALRLLREADPNAKFITPPTRGPRILPQIQALGASSRQTIKRDPDGTLPSTRAGVPHSAKLITATVIVSQARYLRLIKPGCSFVAALMGGDRRSDLEKICSKLKVTWTLDEAQCGVNLVGAPDPVKFATQLIKVTAV